MENLFLISKAESVFFLKAINLLPTETTVAWKYLILFSLWATLKWKNLLSGSYSFLKERPLLSKGFKYKGT